MASRRLFDGAHEELGLLPIVAESPGGGPNGFRAFWAKIRSAIIGGGVS